MEYSSRRVVRWSVARWSMLVGEWWVEFGSDSGEVEVVEWSVVRWSVVVECGSGRVVRWSVVVEEW